jgi:hypothetical protein
MVPPEADPTPAPAGVLSTAHGALRALVTWLLSPAHRWRAALVLALVVTNLSVGGWRAAHNQADLIYGYLVPTRGMLFEGKDPFTDYGFNSFTPFFYVVMAPLAPLPDTVASVVWNLVGFTLLAASLGLVRDLFRRTLPGATLASAAWAPVLGLLLVADNVNLGQSNLFTLFFVCAAAHALVDRQDFRAGLWLSVAISFKVTPAIFLLYLVLRGRVRALVGAALGGVVCVGVLPALLFGFTRALAFTQEWWALVVGPFLSGQQVRTNNVSWYSSNQSLEAFLVRHLTPYATNRYGGWHAWLDPAFLEEAQASRLALVLKAVLVLLLVLVCVKGRRVGPRLVLVEVSLFALVALFVSPVSWYNHYVGAVVAYAVVAQEAVMLAPGTWRRRGLLVVLGMASAAVTFSVTSPLRSYSLVFMAHFILFGVLYAHAWRLAAGGREAADGAGR